MACNKIALKLVPYQLCCCVFFWLGQEIVLGCTDRSVFWLWRENPKQSAQKYCGASSRQISNNRLSCQNTNTTNHTLIYKNSYWVSSFYRNNEIQTFCYCISLSCIVWIYNLTVMIISQKYQELSVQVEISE